MSPELKAFLRKNEAIIESEELDKLICREVITKGLLEELLDFLCDVGYPLSTEVVTRQLIAYYVNDNPKLTANQKEALELKVRYFINKHQVFLMNTIV